MVSFTRRRKVGERVKAVSSGGLLSFTLFVALELLFLCCKNRRKRERKVTEEIEMETKEYRRGCVNI